MLKIIKAFFILLRYPCYDGFKVFQFYKGETVFFRQDTPQVVTAESQRHRCTLTNGFKPILLQRHKPLKNTEKHFYIFVTSRISTLLERGTGPAYKSSNSLSPFSTFKSLKVESLLR